MVKWLGCSLYMYHLGFKIFISWGLFFASSLKPVMVSFRVPNFHDLSKDKKISVI